VTGASDGIGKEIAIQLAQKGFNLVLISRTESKLQVLAKEIETKYAGQKIKTKVLPMDFAKNDEGDYAKLKALVDGLDVAILINNVGQSHSMPVPFVQTPKAEIHNIININCIGTLKITQIVAPGMVQRKRGLIFTMGSIAGIFPSPLLATYSGSKAFLQHWSSALGAELKPAGVDVHLCISYLVTTAMSKVRRPTMLVPTAKAFARSALSKIGLAAGSQGRPFTSTPFWAHALFQWWVETVLGAYSSIFLALNKSEHESIRKRALRKQEREGKKSL
jgi:17beta-estradiol 17-dehydrogenase / very-long-chain 3-oxoacyl-CoA reductase